MIKPDTREEHILLLGKFKYLSCSAEELLDNAIKHIVSHYHSFTFNIAEDFSVCCIITAESERSFFFCHIKKAFKHCLPFAFVPARVYFCEKTCNLLCIFVPLPFQLGGFIFLFVFGRSDQVSSYFRCSVRRFCNSLALQVP